MKIKYFLILLFSFQISFTPTQDETSIPSKLAQAEKIFNEEPDLPLGIKGESSEDYEEEPTFPDNGNMDEEEISMETSDRKIFPFNLNGFLDGRVGIRAQDDPEEKDTTLGEIRLQLEIEEDLNFLIFKSAFDILYDEISDDNTIDLEEGTGWIDLRELNLSLRPIEFMDVKLGRQILTWGTGDLLFINDLFPKDWNAFFIGRDLEYLKSPSDSIKISFFSQIANLDIVYTPCFDFDRYIDGTRISYWNPNLSRLAGRDMPIKTQQKTKWFSDDEFACRFYKNINGYEFAIYGYYGYWKSPAGYDINLSKWTFPRLAVYGSSIRGAFLKGISNFELGYYNSIDDSDGINPYVKNSEFRSLVGYERELIRDFTVGFQYYLEHMMDYGEYKKSLPITSNAVDENRHLITIRFTKLFLNQNLITSIFTFFSPSDEDFYIRPHVKYKIDDYWSIEIGGNIFRGSKDYTFFGQFENNTNLFIGLRFGF